MRFLFGSQNFGLDTPESDKDYMEFVFPHLGDLCRAIPSARERKNADGSITKRIDVRAVTSLFYKSNLDTLQLLFSKEVTDGGCLEDYFAKHEQELSSINLPRLYQSVMGTAINRYKRETSKDLAHIVFGFKTLIQFEEQGFTDLRKCFEHNDKNLYQDIRTGNYSEWYDYSRGLEEQALKKMESYMRQTSNDVFKERMDMDFGNMVIQYILGGRLRDKNGLLVLEGDTIKFHNSDILYKVTVESGGIGSV